MTLKAIYQELINCWVSTSHFIDLMIFIIFSHQVLHNFAPDIKALEEGTREAANNT